MQDLERYLTKSGPRPFEPSPYIVRLSLFAEKVEGDVRDLKMTTKPGQKSTRRVSGIQITDLQMLKFAIMGDPGVTDVTIVRPSWMVKLLVSQCPHWLVRLIIWLSGQGNDYDFTIYGPK